MKRVYVFFILVLIGTGVYAENIKEAEFAGSFYPRDAKVLNTRLEEFFAKAEVSVLDGEILGVISPHAGYIYSGPVAAYSFKILKDKEFDAVIILAPSHRYSFKGISIYPDGGFESPLGILTVDNQLTRQFESLEFVQFKKDYFNGEHSIEVQLPFITKILNNVKIVPVIFGEVTYQNLESFADKLSEISQQKKILIVVSTDLSHYHPYAEAEEIDQKTIEFIQKNDTSSLWNSSSLDENRACGINALISFLIYAEKRNAGVKVLNYANSGDTAGDKNRVVGYVSAAVLKMRDKKVKVENDKMITGKEAVMAQGYSLNNEDKVILLKAARSTLESFLKDGKKPEEVKTDSVNLKVNRGAFVTLHKNGQLRGCIGTMAADTPLYKVVPEFAVYSATQDRRFTPVTYDELKDIEIEISVLTQPQYLEAGSWQDLMSKLQPLRDGVIIISQYGSSTYLPQVWEQLSDKENFLSSLCDKGGLPSDYWKKNFKDIKVQTYQAIVFKESEFE